MKSNALGTKIFMVVLCLGVLFYFGLQGYNYYHDPLSTTVAYSYQEEVGMTVTGWVVRQEQVLEDDTSGLLSLTRGEGEKVAKGGRIAVVYSDESSLQRRKDMDDIQTRIDQLEYAREAEVSSEAGLRLDNQIVRQLQELRADVTTDELADAEEHIRQLRSMVLKRDFSHAGGDVEAELQSLKERLAALDAKHAGSSRSVAAPVAGIYSAVADGYESVLTPESLPDLRPSAINQISAEHVNSQLGRIITGDTWYYAASMSARDAQRLTVGRNVTLRFVKGAGRDLTVKVTSISPEENGRVVVVFSSRQYLSELTLMRRQSADIILTTLDGIRIPSNAIRVTDEGVTGVYCVVGMSARFKPVDVVYTDEGYALVRAAAIGDGKTVLRAGDQIIITARDLYDGKIVE